MLSAGEFFGNFLAVTAGGRRGAEEGEGRGTERRGAEGDGKGESST